MQSIMPILIDASLKGLAILLLAMILTAVMRKHSAAARHIVWTGAVVAVLTMPLLSVLLPGLAVLPTPMVSEITEPTVEPTPQTDAAVTAPEQPQPEQARIQPDHTSPPAAAADTASPSESSLPSAAAPDTAPTPEPRATATPSADPWWQPWLAWLPWIWLGGAISALIPLLLGWLSLWHLKPTTQRITASGGGSWQALLAQLTAEIGLQQPVTLLQSPCRTMPMTWGALAGIVPGLPGVSAKVLIPEDADAWSPQRRRAVLLHELAHIKRHDCLTQMLTQLACALYWFNPLMWLAAHRMLIERERACDDLVLTHETKPSDYAQHLLDIATGPPPEAAGLFTAHAGIAMARRSQLDGRLVAILDQHRNRRAMSRLGVALTITLIGAVAVPVAMLQAESEPAADEVVENTQDDVSSQPVFGPVMHQTFVDELAYLNFGREQLDRNAEFLLAEGKEGLRQAREHGVDAVFHPEEPVRGLLVVETTVIPMGNHDNLDIELGASFFEPLEYLQSATLTPIRADLPMVYLFRTRENVTGLLRIVEMTEDPWRLTIEYRLLEDAELAANRAPHDDDEQQAVAEQRDRRRQSNKQAREIHQAMIMHAETAPQRRLTIDIAELYENKFFTADQVLSPTSPVTLPEDFDNWPQQRRNDWLRRNASYILVPNLTDDLDGLKIAVFLRPEHSDGSGISVVFNNNQAWWHPYVDGIGNRLREQTGMTMQELIDRQVGLANDEPQADGEDGDEPEAATDREGAVEPNANVRDREGSNVWPIRLTSQHPEGWVDFDAAAGAEGEPAEYRWALEVDRDVTVLHGWVSYGPDGSIDEHIDSGGVIREPNWRTIPLMLDVAIEDGQLVLTGGTRRRLIFPGLRQADREEAAPVLLQMHQRVPNDAQLRMRTLPGDEMITAQESAYQTLWEGQWVRDGEVVRTIRYMVRVATEPVFRMDEAEQQRPVRPLPEAAGELTDRVSLLRELVASRQRQFDRVQFGAERGVIGPDALEQARQALIEAQLQLAAAEADGQRGAADAAEQASRMVYLTGPVGRPGAYVLPEEGMTLLQLIASAGNVQWAGGPAVIEIVRQQPDGSERRLPRIRVSELFEGEAENPRLQADDVVIIRQDPEAIQQRELDNLRQQRRGLEHLGEDAEPVQRLDWRIEELEAGDSPRGFARANEMRQVLIGIHVYVQDHDDQLPADLKAVELYTPAVDVEQFQYARPAERITEVQQPPKTPVIFEVTPERPDGWYVGFLDGHVELVTIPQRHEELRRQAGLANETDENRRGNEQAPPESRGLQFRIVPTRDTLVEMAVAMIGDDAHEAVVDVDEAISQAKRALADWGPEVLRQHDVPYAWFPLREGLDLEESPMITAEHEGRTYLLVANRELLVMRPVVDGERQWRLKSASVAQDQQGRPSVVFELDEAGGQQMRELTSANIHRSMAVLLDGEVLTAARLMSTIADRVQITGSFTDDFVKEIVERLRAVAEQ